MTAPFSTALAPTALTYAEIPHDTRVYLSPPQLAVPEYRGRGRKPIKARVLTGKAKKVADVAATLCSEQWQHLILKEGSKGPILAELSCIAVFVVRQGEDGRPLELRELQLVLRRDVLSGELKTYLSNTPNNTPLETFARISVMRWPIESCFEEGKQELGMGDYQVRGYRGWHHHMTLVILAHFFLVKLKLQLKDKAPNLTLPQTVLLLKASLPQPEFDLDKAVRTVNYYQQRHEAARRSHRKKRLAQLEEWVE